VPKPIKGVAEALLAQWREQRGSLAPGVADRPPYLLPALAQIENWTARLCILTECHNRSFKKE